VISGWQLLKGYHAGENLALYVNGPPGAGSGIPIQTTVSFFGHLGPAWYAMDSPLPLIALFRQFRGTIWPDKPLELSTNVQVQHAAVFLQEVDAYAYTETFAPELLKIMAAAGMNPIMWGGPNIPPGSRPPAWNTYYLQPKVMLRDGWAHPVPEVAWCPLQAGSLLTDCPAWTQRIRMPG
jgi:hypothetical protein